MIEPVECSGCGGSDVFLRKKGGQIGLYCLACGKWYKWLNKKVVEAYKHRGYKVNNEDWTPATSAEPLASSVPTVSSEQPSVKNSDLLKFSRPVEPEDKYDDFDLGEEYVSEVSSRNALKSNTQIANQLPTKSEPQDLSDLGPCLVCVSGAIDPLTLSDDARITIFEGVMTVHSIKKPTAHGFFKIKYCPGCGKKL